MARIIKSIEVDLRNYGPATIIIYDTAQLAIYKNWNSLYFSSNKHLFATIECGNIIMNLVTCGDTIVQDYGKAKDSGMTLENGMPMSLYHSTVQTYYNHNELQIRQLIDRQCPLPLIVRRNWFAVTIEEKTDNWEQTGITDLIESTPFTAIPYNIDDLIKELTYYATNLLD